MIDVIVRFFGPLREIAGSETLTITLPLASSGDAAFAMLAERYPDLKKWRQSVRLAVNLEYAQFSRELHTGDEISFIPPVSGG